MEKKEALETVICVLNYLLLSVRELFVKNIRWYYYIDNTGTQYIRKNRFS